MMKFKFVKLVTGEVPSYNGNIVKTGDIIELEGHLAAKAKANPDYEVFSKESPIKAEPTDEKVEPDAVKPPSLAKVRQMWKSRFGTTPHHNKSAKKMLEELNGNQG